MPNAACAGPPAFVYPSAMHPQRRSSRPRRLVPGLACLFALAALLVAARSPVDRLERKLYDLYLGLSGPSRSPADLLALYPERGKGAEDWSEGEAEAALRLLGEFGARSVALADPGFGRVSASERLDSLRSGLPGFVDGEYGAIERNVSGLFEAIRSGTLPPKELGRSVDLLLDSIRSSGERLKRTAAGEGEKGGGSTAADPASPRIVAAGSFVGSLADPDGVLRSVILVKDEEGRILPSYELAALEDYLGAPSLERRAGSLVLRGCAFPGGSSRDLVLPIDGAGRFRLGWPRPGSPSAPRSLALSELRSAIREEAALVANLEALEAGGSLGSGGAVLLSRYRRAELLRSELAAGSAQAEDWRETREDFFSAALAYFQAEGASAKSGDQSAALRGECLGLALSLESRRKALGEALKGSFVLLAPREESPAPATIYGSPTDQAQAGAVFAALVLSGRYPRAGPAAFRVAVVLLLTFLALALAAISIALGRRAEASGGGLLRRAAESRSEAGPISAQASPEAPSEGRRSSPPGRGA